MILFLTTRGHQYTLGALVGGLLGVPIPKVLVLSYDAAFRALRIPDATIVFTDIERLYPWEQQLAADLYRSYRSAGLLCLNDPAVVPGRYELLRRLRRAGINPFDIYRAEDRPQPERFPVFVRGDQDHRVAVSDLLGSQAELDAFLDGAVAEGRPLRGLVVIEYCGEPVAECVWRKFGSFRIGESVYLDHHVTERNWLVKYGQGELSPEWLTEEEHRLVVANACPPAVGDAFRMAGIEYGRADHALVDGQPVIYEINTNPAIWRIAPQRRPIRDQTLALGRARMAEALWAIDRGDGAPKPYQASERVERHRKALKDKDWSPPRP